MVRPRKVPAVLVEATIRSNGKLACLPTDSARLGYFYICLGAAKLIEPIPDQFASRAHFREIAGRFARYVDDYVRVGLLEEAPKLCARCKKAWSATPPAKGMLVTHDWHEHQYDPRRLDRQREYDERLRAAEEAARAAHAEASSTPQSDGVSSPVSDAQSDGVSDAQSDEKPPESAGVSDAVSGTNLPPDSRGRARDRASNVERRTENVESLVPSRPRRSARRNGKPTTQEAFLTAEQLEAWAGYGREWDAFKRAWLERGFRLPPSGDPTDDEGESQRSALYSVVRDWPNRVAQWVAEAPAKASAHDVVAHVLAMRNEARGQAADDEPGWFEGPSPEEAAESVASILARTIGR